MKIHLIAVFAAILGASSAPARANEPQGVMCVAEFRHTAKGYYGPAGFRFAFVSWARDEDGDLSRYEQFLDEKSEGYVAESAADPASQLLDDTEFLHTSCERLVLAEGDRLATSTGQTTIGVNSAIVDRMGELDIFWYFNRYVTFPDFDEPAPQVANADEEPPAESVDDATDLSSTAEEGVSRSEEEADLAAREAEAKREQERLEAEETARLNREVAEFAARQIAENEASRLKAEADRKAYAEALATAEREKAEYDRAMEQNRREREEADRLQQEYFAAQRRHTRCIGGDDKACADIMAGKPAMGEQLADAGEASTDTDARQCVSSPVLAANQGSRGNTSAAVVNGCPTAVDVRICLLRTGGWNCGVTWGLDPQERWSHSSFEATGEVFWDARVASSSRALSSPE